MMSGVLRWLHLQLADLVSAFLAPVLGALVPARMNKSVQWRVARFRWLFPDRSRLIDRVEAACFERPFGLGRHWRWTTLMEACECWRLILGLEPRLRVSGQWPDKPGFLAAGLHYGVGIGILWHLREAGLKPRLVYRAVTAEALPGRPVLRLWYRLRHRLVHRLCPDGPIVTGGARSKLEQALSSASSTPVVIVDTPTPEPRPWQLQLGRCRTSLRGGIFELIRQSDCPIAFFRVGVNRATGYCDLMIERLPASGDHAGMLLERINQILITDPGQWQLWPSMAHLADG